MFTKTSPFPKPGHVLRAIKWRPRQTGFFTPGRAYTPVSWEWPGWQDGLGGDYLDFVIGERVSLNFSEKVPKDKICLI